VRLKLIVSTIFNFEFGVVIYFAVADNPSLARFTFERLISAVTSIHNGQTMKSEDYAAGGLFDNRAIWPPMKELIEVN
jgi:hypothetical protein